MRSVYESQLDSETFVAGEDIESALLNEFSLREKETDEARETARKHCESWKTSIRKWRSEQKKEKNKIQKKIDVLRAKLLETDNEVISKNINDEIERLKSYYSPSDPPFPASDVSILTQAEYLAGGEYIEKPYNLESLTELVESSQRLKASIKVSANNSVGLGQKYRPTKGRKVADFTPEELEQYHEQGKSLLDWYNSRVEVGKKFYQKAYEVGYDKFGLGEGYFEVGDTRAGNIKFIRTIKPTYIFEGKNRDRYIWIKNGKKKYFKRWEDTAPRNSDDFSSGGTIDKRATRLVPYREYNLVSDVYGIPCYTSSIPQILGGRYAAERNVNQQINDATPRMIISVAGGAVDDATKNTLKKYFQLKGKGRENAGRVMLLCVNSKNSLSPLAKPPTVTFEPLTVGKTDDASFMKYQSGCNEDVREAFRISNTFFGSSGDSNRASSYTLRDQVVRTVFLPEAENMENLCNDTFTKAWAIENGFITVDKNGEIVEDNLLAEFSFEELSTMSQKDEREIAIAELVAGATTINDYRSDVLGLPEIDHFWAKMPRTLAVTAIQLSEVSPGLVAAMLDDQAMKDAILADVTSDAVEGNADSEVIEDTMKAITMMRQGLQQAITHKHIKEPTLRMLDKYYSLVAESVRDDNSTLAQVLNNLRDNHE